MEIGIIGYGKMGKDIFALLFDKLKTDRFTVLDLYGAEENTAAVMKSLGKSLKRNKLTEEEYEFKKDSFSFTDDINAMSKCDIIIEAVFEKMDVKKDIFSKLDAVVSEKCLLLSNTSSLSIPEVFSGISHKERCFGLHFFYPVKLTGFVELNILPETSQECISTAEKLVEAIGKKPLILSGEYHIYLNQILACTVSHAIYLREKYGVSAAEFDKNLEDLFPTVGIFGVLDSIGLGLMAGSPDGFTIRRNQELLAYGCQNMNKWLGEGCPKETLCFLDFMAQHESDTGNSCDGAELDMIALILNETVNALEDLGGNATTLIEAICDTVGIAEKPSHYYTKYGADTIFAALEELSQRSGFKAYEHRGKSVWDKYFSDKTGGLL